MKLITTILTALLLFATSVLGAPNTTPVGVNIEAVADWSAARPFTNLAMQARAPGNPQTPWDGGAAIGANGWPTADFGMCFITSTEEDVAGTYKLVTTGRCVPQVIATTGSVKNITYDPATNTTTADVVVTGGKTVYLAFTQTGGKASNIRLYQPGFDTTAPTFTPQFVKSLAPFSVLRLMDFTETNNNPVTTWAGRTQPDGATQAGTKGASWECVTDLANKTGKDIWINIPVGADDDYVSHLAALLLAKLDPKINVYVEYSNELWNNQFGQTAVNRNLAIAEVTAGEKTLNLGGADANIYYWGYRRVAKRECEIGKIFRSVWGEQTRVRPVLASMAAIPSIMVSQVEYVEAYAGPAKKALYGIACAPYYGIPDELRDNASATPGAIVDALKAKSTYLRDGIATYHAVALAHGLKSIAYEGGVDLGQSDISVSAKIASQLDPRMRAITADYLNGWYAGGGDLFVYYNHTFTPSVHGYWGLTTKPSDLNQPKYLGAVDVTAAAAPPVTAGQPVGKIPFSAFSIKTLWSQVVNGDVQYLNAPESFYYLVRADTAGVYNLKATIASGNTDIPVDVMVNGEAKTVKVNGAGWGTYSDVTLPDVTLLAGLNAIRFRTSGMNLRAFTLTAAPVAPGPVTPAAKKVKLLIYEDGTWGTP